MSCLLNVLLLTDINYTFCSVIVSDLLGGRNNVSKNIIISEVGEVKQTVEYAVKKETKENGDGS